MMDAQRKANWRGGFFAASALSEGLGMENMMIPQRSEVPTGFPAGVTLAEVEHEQKRELYERTQLLVAQLKLDCQ